MSRLEDEQKYISRLEDKHTVITYRRHNLQGGYFIFKCFFYFFAKFTKSSGHAKKKACCIVVVPFFKFVHSFTILNFQNQGQIHHAPEAKFFILFMGLKS